MADPDPRTFRELGESRTDGPYSVVDATLARADRELLDRADLLGATGPNSWRAFELASERFDLPAFADEGVDADGPYRLVDLSVYRLGAPRTPWATWSRPTAHRPTGTSSSWAAPSPFPGLPRC